MVADDGKAPLSGSILADEVDRALMGVRLVPGGAGVAHRLEAHRRPDSVPGLQGAASAPTCMQDLGALTGDQMVTYNHLYGCSV